MHLPFTFATGEATLYQTGFPLHGFPDSFQGKAKGSKSKKGKLDKSCSEDLDPKSLLGALMSQDESVYVCQPDPEPKVSYHSSLFSQQQSDGDGFGGLLSGDSWHMESNGEMGRCSNKTPSCDPLLATLDSLSLEGEEPCSNSELFSALENLGLNAEDLELLLLDERMIQVELGPNRVPTLGDLLTNNEILSYIHDSLEPGTEGAGQGDGAQSVSQQPQTCLTAAVPPAPPITQLSQQMLQHIGAEGKAHPEQIQPGAADTRTSTGTESRHHPHAVLRASQLNGEHKLLLESSPQWQLQQDQHPVHLQPHQQASSQSFPLLPGFRNLLTTNGSHIPNGHVEVGHPGYNISGAATPDVGHYQTSYQLQGDHKHRQLPPPSVSQCPTQSSALELEQLLGLSQPQHRHARLRPQPGKRAFT